jgi:Zn-dependent peptidase ImmA (M78 family)
MDHGITDRVREIIAASGSSQRSVAERIGIDAPKLSKSLKGERKFTSYELAALAELGGRTMEWLLTGAGARSYSFAYRAMTDQRAEANAAGREMVSLIADRFDVAVDLGFAPPVPELPDVRVSSGYVATAERGALAAVQRIGSTIRDLDIVALIDLLEGRFGINVAVEELPDGIDGLSFRDGDLRVIVVDATHNASRQRFTLAHELAHVIFGDADGEVIEERVFVGGSGHQEPRANSFAAALLMPKSEILDVLDHRPPTDAFDDLVWRFRVSPDSLAWRLHNLSLIDEVTCRRLARRTAKAVADAVGAVDEHLRRSQQASIRRPAGRLSRAYIAAFFAGEIAAGPVAEINGMSERAVHDLKAQLDSPAEWSNLFEAE